ncbi:MAG: hypothetical protein QM778_33255 [Myxococcales bacterium]
MREPFYICVGERIDNFPDPKATLAVCDPAALAEEQEAERASAELREAARSVDREVLRKAILMLPHNEQAAIQAHLAGEREKAVGQRLGLTQQGVSYRLRRAVERLTFIVTHGLVEFDAQDLLACIDMLGMPLTAIESQILVVFVETASYSEVARRLGLRARDVQRRVRRLLPVLATTRYGKLFAALAEQTNILRQVDSASWRACTSAQPAQCAAPAPAYDGPYDLRPITRDEAEAIRRELDRGRTPSAVAQEYELDPQYMDFAVFGAWGSVEEMR